MKILVSEEDEFIAHTLTTILTSQNYAVEVASDGQVGWSFVEAFDYDLVLLDVMLPKLYGIGLCRKIRAKGLQMPILLVTGRDSSHDKAIGLDAGADDYVVKPFEAEELVARVRALLRRGGAIAQPVLKWGELRLDPSSCEVTYDTTPLLLTPKEYALLELFLRNSRRVFSCGMILEHLWSYEETPGEDAIRTHIKGLRQKLKAAGLPNDVVETVYGIGYRLKPRKDAELATSRFETRTVSAPSLPIPGPAAATPQQMLASIHQVWHRFKGRVSEQVGVLEQAVIALWQKELDQDLRQQARQEAHTLARSLGTFGVPEGSKLARQIERAFQSDQPLSQTDAINLRNWVTALRQEVEQPHDCSIEAPPGVSSGDLPSSTEEAYPLLLIVERDRTLTNQLSIEAKTYGLRAEVASNLTRARDKLLFETPAIVLLDPAVAPAAAENLSLLVELSKQVPPIPVVILTEHPDLAERLEVARLGGGTFLPKATPPAQVLATVKQVLQQADRAKASVMVVDDDPALLAIVRALLEAWGLKVTTLANPAQFWDVLEATAPDLLILDVEMPHVSGIELCQVVRSDAQWGNVPILFLTAHTDAETVNQVYSVGADDFVSKPIVGPELVTRIINRLERSRLVRQLIKTAQASLSAPVNSETPLT